MKKILNVLMLVLAVSTLLVGCDLKKKDDTTNNNNPKTEVKSNTNQDVIREQTVGVYKFTNTSLTYVDGQSTFRASVTNTSSTKASLKEFKINLYDEKNNKVVTLTGYIGDSLGAGETKTIDASYGSDLTNVTRVEYDVIQ